MNHYSKDTIASLRDIPLDAVLGAQGAKPDQYDKFKWHTTDGAMSITNAKFFNWSHNVGGGGAIDLAMHLNKCDFKSALQWLEQHFPDYFTQKTPKPSLKPNFKKLNLPTPDSSNLHRVTHYLVEQRAIPHCIVDDLINIGTLYADKRANAVFLLLGKQQIPVGAEIRSTNRLSWRGLAPGSSKSLGFFSISPHKSTKGIILCESAIDAISCSVILPHCRCISTAGATPNPSWLPALIQAGVHIFCGFDSDSTGDAVAKAMTTLYPDIKRIRPPTHDWNDLLRDIY